VVFAKTYLTFLPSRAANRQIHSEYFNHSPTKQIEILPLNLLHARVKKLNPHAKMNEINPKYENTRNIHRLLTNQNPGFLYKV
jgi:tRNA A37 threonylcarbamoyladenosine dehydratase